MKRRAVALTISDHAVLRFLQRRYGIDVERVRQHLAGKAMTGAELQAIAVKFEGVKLALAENGPAEDGAASVAATTALYRDTPVYRREAKP